MDEVINASASSRRLISGLISAFPETRSAVDEAMAVAIWALFQEAYKHGHQLSAEAQHKLWLSQSGDTSCCYSNDDGGDRECLHPGQFAPSHQHLELKHALICTSVDDALLICSIKPCCPFPSRKVPDCVIIGIPRFTSHIRRACMSRCLITLVLRGCVEPFYPFSCLLWVSANINILD